MLSYSERIIVQTLGYQESEGLHKQSRERLIMTTNRICYIIINDISTNEEFESFETKNQNKEKIYILEIPEVKTRIKEEIISLRRYFKRVA